MQAVHSWMRRPPGRGTCKVHALDGEAREPIGEAWCGREKIKIFEDLNPVGLEYGWLTYRGQAFKKVELPVWVTGTRTLETNSAAIPVAQAWPF